MATAAGVIRMRLFGRPDVGDGEAVSALRPERHHRLLAYLALNGAWIERSELATLFWPAHARELAHANLRKALHLARALPWAGALEAQGSAVRFLVGCDVHDFEVSAREARIGDALRLRRGELLDGFDDAENPAWSEWLAAERARLANRWQALARMRLKQPAAAPHESAALARELLALDPLDEDAVIGLLNAQRLAGRSTEQRDTYRHYADELLRETGLAPSPRVSECLDARGGDRGADGFVGREREIEELVALLGRAECRVLTVTGPGGVGKSRLLKEAVRRQASLFSSSLWLPLHDMRTASHAVARLASSLGLVPGAKQDAMALVCAHTKLRRMVLLFDNAENVDGFPRFVERLLAEVPGLEICASSRARLAVPGEWLLPLSGLALPVTRETHADPMDADAARLFIAAAIGVQPGFDVPAHANAIARLVRAVDGLPLAILLAANWVRLLPVARISPSSSGRSTCSRRRTKARSDRRARSAR